MIKQRIAQLVQAHGSLRQVAEALRIDVGYLSRLSNGLKTEPSDEVLHRLGLKRVVRYVDENEVCQALAIGNLILQPGRMPGRTWIGRSNGEGGDFSTIELEAVLQDYYRRNF